MEFVLDRTVAQLDSLLESCRRIQAEQVIISTRANFFAAQTSGKDMEEYLKVFRNLLEDPKKRNDLKAFIELTNKSQGIAVSGTTTK